MQRREDRPESGCNEKSLLAARRAEVNPLAGLNPVHSDLPILCRLAGIPYHELIAMIMTSARERIDNAHTSALLHRRHAAEDIIQPCRVSEGTAR